LSVRAELLFLQLIYNPEQIPEHIKMVYSVTGFLVGAWHFVLLYLSQFSVAVFCFAALLGNSLVIPF
jgi:hypothetical protein